MFIKPVLCLLAFPYFVVNERSKFKSVGSISPQNGDSVLNGEPLVAQCLLAFRRYGCHTSFMLWCYTSGAVLILQLQSLGECLHSYIYIAICARCLIITRVTSGIQRYPEPNIWCTNYYLPDTSQWAIRCSCIWTRALMSCMIQSSIYRTLISIRCSQYFWMSSSIVPPSYMKINYYSSG